MDEQNKPIHSDTQEYSEVTKGLQPKHINTRHRALMRRLVAGIPLREAAEELGYTIARASLVVNSPLFREEMRKMQEEVKSEFVKTEGSKVQSDLIRVRFREESSKAVDTLVELRDKASSERVRQLSAIEILNKAGYKETERVESEVMIDASDELVEAINVALSDMRKKDGNTDTGTTGTG